MELPELQEQYKHKKTGLIASICEITSNYKTGIISIKAIDKTMTMRWEGDYVFFKEDFEPL